MFQNAIINYTHTPVRRLDITVGTAYGDDMRRVRDVVLQSLSEVPGRDMGRPVELFFLEFADSSSNFEIRIWLNRADELTYVTARSEALIAIKTALDEAGLTIPFPIRTLDFGAHVVGGQSLQEAPVRVLQQPDEAATG